MTPDLAIGFGAGVIIGALIYPGRILALLIGLALIAIGAAVAVARAGKDPR